MEAKEYWEAVAAEKEFTTPFHAEEFGKFVGREGAILDVGCGYGRTLEELRQLGYRKLTGIDFSEKMIARGRETYPSLDLEVKRSDKIDFADGSFDAVILFAVLTCIVDDAEQKKLMDEIERVLRPEGIVYINDFLLNADERNLKRYSLFEEKYGRYGVFELPEGGVVRHHSDAWLKSCVAPFEVLALKKVEYTTMNGNRSNGFYFIGRKKARSAF